MDAKKLILTSPVVYLLNKNYVQLFDNDDDDDSEEERLDEEVCTIMQKFVTIPRVSVQNFWEHTVPGFTDERFIKFFRVSRETFFHLAQMYKESPAYQNICNQPLVTSADKSLAIFLWFSSTERVNYDNISNLFNVAISTVHAIIRRLLVFISCLSPRYIKWPTVTEMKEESENHFTRSGIHGIIGAVDGTHIRIDPPPGKKDDYIDRKGDITIMVQAVCNSEKKFIHVSIGYPGSIHDARAFRCSELPDLLANLPKDYFLLGDSAYPLSEKLMTPYRDNGHLTTWQKLFNERLSKSRVMIEHSFGILKQRFRQLYYCKLKGIVTLHHFIRACFVLHNICKIDDVEVLGIDPEMCDNYPPLRSVNSHRGETETRNIGKAKRDEICALLHQATTV